MKLKILTLALILALTYAFTANEAYAQTPIKKKATTTTTTTPTAPVPVKKADATNTTATKKAAKPMKGQVVNFNDLVMGGTGKVTKDEAIRLSEAGNPIVFKVAKKIYFVYNEDGTFAGKKLAKYANNEFVGIVGKAKTVNGINIIIMTMIDSM